MSREGESKQEILRRMELERASNAAKKALTKRCADELDQTIKEHERKADKNPCLYRYQYIEDIKASREKVAKLIEAGVSIEDIFKLGENTEDKHKYEFSSFDFTSLFHNVIKYPSRYTDPLEKVSTEKWIEERIQVNKVNNLKPEEREQKETNFVNRLAERKDLGEPDGERKR